MRSTIETKGATIVVTTERGGVVVHLSGGQFDPAALPLSLDEAALLGNELIRATLALQREALESRCARGAGLDPWAYCAAFAAFEATQ